MTKILATLCFLCIFFTAQAQIPVDIEGAYSPGRSGGSPEGGAHLFILGDSVYVVAYFGGVQVGKININADHLVTFSPSYYPYDFAVWGRHSKETGDSIRVHFSNFERAGSFIGFGKPGTGPALQRVFNPDPNCFSFPYVCKFKAKADTILLSVRVNDKDEHSRPGLYQFINTAGFNDFIIYYFDKKEDNRPFYAKLKDGKLVFEDQSFLSKKPLPDGENLAFIKEAASAAGKGIEDTLLYNPFYNNCREDIYDTLNYRYDSSKNAYINFPNYEEGEENQTSDDGYNRCYILYPFRQLKQFYKESRPFTVLEKPLFTAKCREEE
jgi:hypothetical protein